jgi:hypothetical protein
MTMLGARFMIFVSIEWTLPDMPRVGGIESLPHSEG